MPRYYRRRYTRTLVKPKKKWATNFVDINANSSISGNKVVYATLLCQNSTQVGVPTPVVVKTGNFKLQCDAYFTLSQASAVEFSIYIMYVPEGLVPIGFDDTKEFIDKHPEWILAWKYSTFDYVSGTSNIETIRVSSRLKRNLNSGDSIMLIGLGTTGSGITYSARGLSGKCQFWTCAN